MSVSEIDILSKYVCIGNIDEMCDTLTHREGDQGERRLPARATIQITSVCVYIYIYIYTHTCIYIYV